MVTQPCARKCRVRSYEAKLIRNVRKRNFFNSNSTMEKLEEFYKSNKLAINFKLHGKNSFIIQIANWLV